MTGAQAEYQLSWDEIGTIYEALSFASRPVWVATKRITEEFSLGPRGAWILNLIDNGQNYPRDIAAFFKVGRSLITAELTRLSDAGLITSQQNADDRRRMELTLTPTGLAALKRVRGELRRMLQQHLVPRYSRDELMLVARMLRDFRESVAGAAPEVRRRPKNSGD